MIHSKGDSMRSIRLAGAALGLAFFALCATASATPADPKNGTDYLTLPEVQQTDAAGKIEVTEFFSYMCPHCNAFEPAIAAWVKKQGDNIVFKRVPISFYPQWVPTARLYYTLEALGKTEQLHAKVFAAIHQERLRLETDEAVAAFMEKQGIDRKTFLDAYNSFSVQTRIRRTTTLQEAYRINGVPTVAVAGRYETSPGILSDHGLKQPEPQLFESTVQVLDHLVAKAKADAKK